MKHPYRIRLAIALIILAITTAAFYGLFYPVKFLDLQISPLIQRVFIDFSVIALVLLCGIVLLTLLLGRFYCSMICPLGILQEISALLLKKKNKPVHNLPIKYFIVAVVFGILAGGSAAVLRFADPYTLFGSAITISPIGITAILIILIVVFVKNRFFCTNICPVGALLGLLSKVALNKIYITDECVSCKMCEKACPSGCINNKIVDNETCIKCLKCLEVCKKNAVKFGIKPTPDVKFSMKRRQIIISASALALFGGMVKAGLVIKDKTVKKIKDIILPPGAGSKERFANKCYNCNLCVENCPNKIIVKADENFPTVHIDYSKGACKYDCAKCGEVCPTGAIKRLKVDEKQKTRIAMAMISVEKCSECGLCSEACPALAIIKEKGKPPLLDAAKCIGCGACKSACHFGAIEIFPIKEQKIL